MPTHPKPCLVVKALLHIVRNRRALQLRSGISSSDKEPLQGAYLNKGGLSGPFSPHIEWLARESHPAPQNEDERR